MQTAEARARYAVRRPARGEVLLGWLVRGAVPEGQEALCPSLAAALQAAALLAADRRCRAIWIFDGRRLYDYDALAPRQRG